MYVIGRRKRPAQNCHLVVAYEDVLYEDIATARVIYGPWKTGKPIDRDALGFNEPEAS